MSTRHPETPGLLAVAHGTRDPRGQAVVRGLLEMRAMRPRLDVRVAHVDVQTPTVAEALAQQVAITPTPPVIVPVLLSSGKHAGADIPGAAARFPGTVTAAPLGPDPELARVASERLAEQGAAVTGPGARVILAAAGSSQPEGQADAERAAGLLEARIQAPVAPAYAAAARPSVGEAVAAARSRGARRVAVATYLTSPGTSPTRSVPGPRMRTRSPRPWRRIVASRG